MKSGKKISSLLLTLATLALVLCILFACSSSVTVSFESDGGTSVPSATLNKGEAVSAPENPTRDGYSFAGWKTQDGALWNFTSPVTKSMTLIASWVKNDAENTATVSFDLKGGDTSSYTSSVTVQKGSVLAEPMEPQRPGYDFVGWFYLGEEFDFTNKVIAGDITLIAHWTLATYAISYDLQGGTLEAPVVEYTTLAEAAIPNPARNGYKFLGWTYEGVSAPVISLVLPIGSYGDIKLVASWELIEYSINYELSGAVLPGTEKEEEIPEGAPEGTPEETPEAELIVFPPSYNVESESFAIPTLTKEHYEFLGWQVNGEGEPVFNLVIEKGSFGDLNLVAVFKPVEYKISYELGEGAVNNESNPLYVTAESEAVTLLAPTFAGYKFVGWQIGGEGEPVAEVVIPAGTTAELSFKAVFEKDTYTVTYFDGNGKTHEGEALPTSFMIDNLPVKLPTLYLNNKCFISWYTDADYTNPITEITECKNITLYAKFVDVSEGLVFTYNGKSYDVTGYIGNADAVYVPEYYKGVIVTGVAGGVFKNSDISEIYLPESIKSIGDAAFLSAAKLKSVVLAESSKLEEIGKNAFAGTALESFTAPKTLKALGDGAFLGCVSLKSVSLENCAIDAIAASAFEGTSIEKIVIPASVEYIFEKAFYNTAKLASVEFGNNSSLSAIYNAAFKNCIALESISIPKNVLSIKNNVFENCEALVFVSFEENSELNYIGNSAFRNCYALTAIKFPEKLISISDYAFYYASKLSSISFDLNGELKTIGKNAFAATAVKEIILPENLESIGESAFAFCYELRDVTFNAKLLTIEKLAFNACAKLDAVSLAAGTDAKADSFNGCVAVEELTVNKVNPTELFGGELPASIKRVTLLNENAIAADILKGCTSLEYVKLPFAGLTQPGKTIEVNGASKLALEEDVKAFTDLFGGTVPASLKTVEITGGSYVSAASFKDCAYIERIILPATTTAIGYEAFAGCNSLSFLSLPLAMTGDDEADYAEITYKVDNEVDGEIVKETVTETVSTKTLSYVFGRKVPTSLVELIVSYYGGETYAKLSPKAFVGSSLRTVTLIGFSNVSDYAFYDVKTITEVYLDASAITEIGDYAFFGASKFTSFLVPASVELIGYGAFEGSGLKAIEFAEGSKLTEIMDSAFMDCEALNSITLPAGVTEISASLFEGCTSLTEFALKDSVTDIGESAFEGCTSLKSVSYGENAALTVIGSYAFKDSGLESFTVPLAVNVIPVGAFENCKALSEVNFTLPKDDAEFNGTLIVLNDAFKNSGLTKIKLPAYTASLGDSAFEACEALASVSFGTDSKLSVIGSRAFAECKSLADIKLAAGIEVLENETFKDCRALKSVSFADYSKLNSILDSVFENCLMLEAIELPTGVTMIGDYVFANCFALAEIKLPLRVETPAEEEGGEPTVAESMLQSIGEGVFKNCDSLTEITLPASLRTLSELVFYNCDKLAKVNFEDGSTLAFVSNSAFLNCLALKSFAAPDSLQYIGESAFQGCSALEAITFGENSALADIDACAFMNCTSLKSFEAPAALRYIGTEAFRGCSALEVVELTTGVVCIENYAFQSTPKLVIKLTYFEEGAHLAWLGNGIHGTYWNTDNNELEFVYVMYLQ